MTNKAKFPSYMSRSKLICLSKTNSSYPKLNDIRPISIESFNTKLIEKVVNEELKSINSILYQKLDYQRGFQAGESTLNNIKNVVEIFTKERCIRKKKMGVLAVDFKKAFDKIDRNKLFKMMWNKALSNKERCLFKIIYKLFANTEFDYNGIIKSSNMGVF